MRPFSKDLRLRVLAAVDRGMPRKEVPASSARRTLHVVTFAAYKIPVLNQAMLAAARRGVEVSLIFESPDAGNDHAPWSEHERAL